VVVYLREAQVLVGEMAQVIEGGFNAKSAAGDGFEEGFESVVDSNASAGTGSV